MSRTLIIHRAGPQVTVQDKGRPGLLGQGVSQGGAADPVALAEGAALLRQSTELAALEMAGMGGSFAVTQDTRIALTGAPMAVSIDGQSLAWNASHLLPAGARLDIGAATRGIYGYLHLGGGIATDPVLGARAAHLAAGIGKALAQGDKLPLGEDPRAEIGLTLDPEPRFSGGTLRMTRSLQTGLFDAAMLDRFQSTTFARDARGNRMGARLEFDGAPFAASGQLSILSEVIVPGDIQMTGDGTPFVLLPECQTTGGYPRIGTVIPADLPRVAQAGPGVALRFAVIDLAEAVEIHRRHIAALAKLTSAPRPLLRRPQDIPDLLSYQLISGVVSARPESSDA
ncbi:MAG: biotin-dependent carboxyltransferase family protein [Rhodobacterales bacterium]